MGGKGASQRAEKARAMVFELLVADQPKRETSHDPESKFWHWAADIGVTESRFPVREQWKPDLSHPAMAVNLDACRSEEHTSELQSLMRISYAVFCLKKKKTITPAIHLTVKPTCNYMNITLA